MTRTEWIEYANDLLKEMEEDELRAACSMLETLLTTFIKHRAAEKAKGTIDDLRTKFQRDVDSSRGQS